MDSLITMIRHLLVTPIMIIAWLIFLPITLFFETLALIIWFLVLFLVAVFHSKELLEKSWINNYPVMPKVTRINVKNMYAWAIAINQEPRYIDNSGVYDGFVVVHAFITRITLFILVISVIALFFFFLKWWGVVLICVLFVLVTLVVSAETS